MYGQEPGENQDTRGAGAGEGQGTQAGGNGTAVVLDEVEKERQVQQGVGHRQAICILHIRKEICYPEPQLQPFAGY